MSLVLQQAFGLRREESIKFRPAYADRGDCIVLKGPWTKGGRPRTIRITPPPQRVVLNQARWLAGAGLLIPADKTYIQQRNAYDFQCKAAGLSNMHGLRHHYTQARYQTMTGWAAPAAGGPPVRSLTEMQRIEDAIARQTISHELGHTRIDVVAYTSAAECGDHPNPIYRGESNR